MLGYYRPRHRSSEQILVLVNRARFQAGKDVSCQELFAQVLDYNFAGAGFVSFLDHRIEIISLADIGNHRDHVVGIVFLQPGNNDRGIETSGIGEYDLLRHVRSSAGGSFRTAWLGWLSECA